jgi:cytochrome c oxidase assembly factor CtaG
MIAEAVVSPSDFWRAWSFEPGVVCCLALAAALYARGARPCRGVTPAQMACFWGGIAMLVLALVSPIDALGEALFSGHMTQHEILMLGAAPLFVFARPVPALLWGLPMRARRLAGRAGKTALVRGAFGSLTRPLHAWWLHAAALWIWHAPVLFMATLENGWIHTAQHMSFFVSALCFWWALFQTSRRTEYGHGVFYVFTTAIHTGILGALLTFSPRVIYPVYAASTSTWGLTPLEDQQLGGLIMWMPAGILYMAAGLKLFWMWIQPGEPARSRYAA